MPTQFTRFGLATVLAYCAFAPADASAKILLITSGDTISHLGKIQLPAGAMNGKAANAIPVGVPGLEIGYKWEYGGLFWIDFWTWGGEYCVYQGNNYEAISPEIAAALLGQSSPPSRPFLYKFPLGLLILGGIALFGIVSAIVNRKREARENANDSDLDQYRVERKD